MNDIKDQELLFKIKEIIDGTDKWEINELRMMYAQIKSILEFKYDMDN
ncbi:hypothetical protein vBBcePLY3_00021 [Bacillus phage vB_BceP_LY3]|uniref:Uncharacterized protein n=1 Tax=Bacillus phage vB_BceP_LY3 TaxID=2950458 RepID=A0AAE9LV56_9CAUD|nr:hypothetical protein vBBcePLY3_00021 [Bacillus phage vB_BceP_LY3]